jgi:hypothetical protein
VSASPPLSHRIRSSLLEVGPLLGSWKLSTVLMVTAGLYYGFLAIWSTSSPAHVVQNIARLLPFWIVYGLLLVNTGVCLWRRLPALKRQSAPTPTRGEEPPEWEVSFPAADAEAATKTLRRHGFRTVFPLERGVAGVKRRWAALGTYLFHGAFFLIALGFLLTILTRYEARVWTAVGEEFVGEAPQFLSQSPPRVLSLGAPALSFRVEEIRPQFWRDQLLFTKLEADLLLAGGGLETTRINRPLWVGPATFLRLSGFGYAPRFELADPRGLVLESAFAKLNVFPPGQRDFVFPGRYPFRISVEVFPDQVDGPDGPATASLNLRNPALGVRVGRGKLILAEGLLKPGEKLALEGLTLSFPEIRYWGEFTLVRDAGAPVLFLGFLVGLLGLLLKVRGRRSEVRWTPGETAGQGKLAGWGGSPLASRLSSGPEGEA